MVGRMIKKYRRKPCEVEVIQWTEKNTDEVLKFLQEKYFVNYDGELVIVTHTGEEVAEHGDYIVKDAHFGYYPCKPNVFVKKYELIVNRSNVR